MVGVNLVRADMVNMSLQHLGETVKYEKCKSSINEISVYLSIIIFDMKFSFMISTAYQRVSKHFQFVISLLVDSTKSCGISVKIILKLRVY